MLASRIRLDAGGPLALSLLGGEAGLRQILLVSKEPDLSHRIRVLIASSRYRVRLHAVRHMLEEGFDEGNIIEDLTGPGSKVLEEYPEQ